MPAGQDLCAAEHGHRRNRGNQDDPVIDQVPETEDAFQTGLCRHLVAQRLRSLGYVIQFPRLPEWALTLCEPLQTVKLGVRGCLSGLTLNSANFCDAVRRCNRGWIHQAEAFED